MIPAPVIPAPVITAPDPGDAFTGAQPCVAGAATEPPRPRRAPAIGLGVGIACLSAVVAEVVTDALPDRPLVGAVTSLRLLLAVGLVAVTLGAGPWPLRARGLGRLAAAPLAWSCAALVAAAALAGLLAGAGWSSWRALLTALGAGLLAWAVARASGATALLALAGLAFTVVTLVALGQAGTGEATGYCRGSVFGDLDRCVPGAMTRTTGPFPNPNLAAAALLLLGPPTIAWIRSARDASTRVVGWCVLAGGLVALVTTGSRAAFLALGAALAAYLLLRTKSPRHLLVATAAVLAGVGVSAAYVLRGGDAGIRGTIWRAAADLVAQRPFGTGLGTAGAQLQERSPGGPDFQHAHNLWLNWAVEAGVLGGLAALAVAAAVALGLARAAIAGSEVAVWCGAALAGFGAMSLLDHPANAERIAMLLWIVIGLGVASRHRERGGSPLAGGRPS